MSELEAGRRRLAAEAGLIGVAAVWGLTFVMVQDAIALLPTMAFLGYRFVPAALLVALVFRRQLRRLSAAGWRAGVAMGVLLTAGYAFQTLGLERTTASNAGFITGLFVVFTPLCAGLLLHKRVDPVSWVGVAVATGGLALLSLHGLSVGRGEAITLLCAIAFALHIVGLGEWSTARDADGLAVIQLTTVALVSAVAAAPDSLAPPPDRSCRRAQQS